MLCRWYLWSVKALLKTVLRILEMIDFQEQALSFVIIYINLPQSIFKILDWSRNLFSDDKAQNWYLNQYFLSTVSKNPIKPRSATTKFQKAFEWHFPDLIQYENSVSIHFLVYIISLVGALRTRRNCHSLQKEVFLDSIGKKYRSILCMSSKGRELIRSSVIDRFPA